jgi:hypothetical protein
VDRHAELGAVALQRLHLHARELVADLLRRGGAVGGHVVVRGGERAVGAANLPAGQPQGLECLRRGHLVHEVEVHVEEAVGHLMRLPDLVEHRLGHAQLLLRPAATTA